MESIKRRRGVSLAAIKKAEAERQPTSAGYQEAMLEMVERGRDDAGRVGDGHHLDRCGTRLWKDAYFR